MLKVEKRIACAEGLAVIDLLSAEERAKIPLDFINKLEENTLKEIKVCLRKEIPLQMQQISMAGWGVMKLILEFLEK